MEPMGVIPYMRGKRYSDTG